ncbi:MAG: hypothetical protein QF541_22270 [Lentisphaeria bacterium]|jgi:hypothetical protein|nr:hypothetical protein [Lentisphaeria bacterium]
MNTADPNEAADWFQAVADTVAGRLSGSNRHFVALAAKWARTDLVPGLSDMDFRIVCDNKTTIEDWDDLARQVGHIHLEMVRAHQQWNRLNEHTPGMTMTVGELMDQRFYNPEYAVWDTWSQGRQWLDDLKADVLARPFDGSDEHFHLMRFLTYYSPYIHGIDPPINLGAFEPKYALHSRCWHYFAPPMLSAACLLARRKFQSKRLGLEWLSSNGFADRQTRAVFRQVDSHYETPELTAPERLKAFEELLFAAFEELYKPVCESIRHLGVDLGAGRDDIRKQLEANQPAPLETLMDCLRWARTRWSRYYFYLNAPDYFSVGHLMEGELVWVRKVTGHVFNTLQSVLGDRELSPQQCLARLGIQVDAVGSEAIDHMFDMPNQSTNGIELRRAYQKAVKLYPHYLRLLERCVQKVAGM